MLVEDDVIVQRVHQLMLSKLGCEVDIAGNGELALQKARDNDYEMIFVDIGLPDIAGFEVIKGIRNLNAARERNVPIIALTGYAGQTEKNACIEAGATEIAYKPIVNHTLRALLERY